MLEKELKVSVKMITYKHEKFIKQAIEGVLMQETDFKFDLIISDDCSPDNTHKIVNEIIINHSKGFKIKYFRHQKNIGMIDNGVFAINKCTGKYIAYCEGDDYWTDALKLQKQVDFMEKNISYSCCAHYSYTKYDTLNEPEVQLYNQAYKNNGIFGKKDFMHVNKFHTSSLLIRKNYINQFLNDNPVTHRDNILKIKLLQFGYIKVLPETMSTYRRNETGISQKININRLYQTEIASTIALGKELKGFYLKSLYLRSHWHKYYLINEKNLSFLYKVKLFFKFLIPSFYRFPRNIRDILSSIYNGFLK